MTKQQNFDMPIHSVSSFYVLAHMLCEGYLYALNTPIQIFIGNKSYLFCLAFDKNTGCIYLASLDAPTSAIELATEKLNAILTETLDLNMPITIINIANINDKKLTTLNNKLSKMNTSALYFADPTSAYKYLIKTNPAHNFPANETIEACWNYMDTVIEHLNKN